METRIAKEKGVDTGGAPDSLGTSEAPFESPQNDRRHLDGAGRREQITFLFGEISGLRPLSFGHQRKCGPISQSRTGGQMSPRGP